MWKIAKLILSATLFAAVAVVVEDARKRPAPYWQSVTLFLATVLSLLWLCQEANNAWEAWTTEEEEPRC